MKNRELIHFKNELSDYEYTCEELKRIEELILVMDTKRGIHAIRYDKDVVQGSCDPLLIELNRLDDIEKYDLLERQQTYYRHKRDYVLWFLQNCEIGDSIKKIHCTRESTYERESRKLFMSVRSLKRRVNKEIINYIENGTRYTI